MQSLTINSKSINDEITLSDQIEFRILKEPILEVSPIWILVATLEALTGFLAIWNALRG